MSMEKFEATTPNEAEARSKSNVNTVYSDRTVYSRPSRPMDNIVNVVLRLMDEDGPVPMKNMRPANKTRNGADQFYLDHHGEYEARGQPSRDRISRVHTHNRAYPTMYDELNKRRSIAQPEVYSTQQNTDTPATYDFYCRHCIQHLKQTDTDGHWTRPNRRSTRQRSSSAKPNLRDTSNKIIKSKNQSRSNRCPSRIFKLSKIRTNKGCQVTSCYVPIEKRSAYTLNDMNFEYGGQPQDSTSPTASPSNQVHPNSTTDNHKSNQQKPKQGSKKASKSDIDSGNPETNEPPSISSYNSFMSMEHEPMLE